MCIYVRHCVLCMSMRACSRTRTCVCVSVRVHNVYACVSICMHASVCACVSASSVLSDGSVAAGGILCVSVMVAGSRAYT